MFSLLLCAGAAETNAQKILSVRDVNATPGSTIKVSVELNDGSGISAIQFKLRYPTSGLSLTGQNAIEKGTLLTDHSITSNTSSPGLISLTVLSLSLQSLKPGAGSVILINFDVASSASGALNLTLEEVIASDSRANVVAVTVQNGKVTVGPSKTLFFAQFANGAGLNSEIALTNPSSSTSAGGRIEFLDDNGQPLTAGFTGGLGQRSRIDFSIPPLGSVAFGSDGQGTLMTGTARVVSGDVIGGVVRFNVLGLGTAGIGESQPITGGIIQVRRKAGVLNTGIAVSDAGGAGTVNLTLRSTDGIQLAAASLSLPANGHRARFMDQLFPNVETGDFQGTLTITASGAGKIAVVAMELGTSAGQFTALPVTPLR
ncbi:MAG: hypothetical protein HY652_00015 [Acidobacteria bacterium]|nr:hypothetical protein [Acidobacteriota bacterium]